MSKIGRGSGVSGSGGSIAEDMYFSTLVERDTFTTENPNRITQGVTCAVVSGDNYDYFQYDVTGSQWRDANLIFQGMRGAQGVQGADGVGVVAGGTTGQVLAKKSNDDYDTEWVNQSGGGGVTEHNLLTNRDAVDQHPITAISGLTEELSQKVDKEAGKALSDENYTSSEKAKLAGVEDQATKNQTDDFLLSRNNHTGSISIATVDNLQSALDDKVSPIDSRLTDAREWIADEVPLEEAQARTSGTFKKWSALRVGQAIVAWWEATGNQAIIDDLISSEDLADALAGKVDKVAGFGLSQANFTQAEKDKLATLEDSKFKGLHEDLPALQIAYPVADAGSYAFVDGKTGNPNQLYMWSTDGWEIVGGEVVSLTPAQVKQLLLENADTNNFSDSDKQKLQDAVTQSELASVLTDYAQVVHSHTIAQVTGLQDELDSKAASDHGHAIANVTGLQAELDSKVDKVAGKGLSTHDYDNTAKSKVDGMGTAASRDVMVSISDLVTHNALMPRGAFGVGEWFYRNLESNGMQERYYKVATLSGLSSVGGAYVSFYLYGSGNFGTLGRETLHVNAIQRGANGVRLDIYELSNGGVSEGLQVGYVQLDEFTFDIYVKQPTFHPFSIQGGDSYLRGTIIKNLVSETVEPENITYGIKRKIHHTGNLKKADSSTPESDDNDYMTKKQVMDLLQSKGLI